MINSPPDSLDSLRKPDYGTFYTVGRGQQLNLFDLPNSTVHLIEVKDGGEVNYSAEQDGDSFTDLEVFGGGTANIFDGSVSTITVNDGGVVRLVDGDITWLDNYDGGYAVVEGGTIRDLTNFGGTVIFSGGTAGFVQVDSSLVVTGGNLLGETGVFFVLGGVAELRGGYVGLETAMTIVASDSRLDFFGSAFSVDGRPIEGLERGRSFDVRNRDVTLTGFLEDGSPFSVHLGTYDSDEAPGLARIADSGSIRVTLTIPEPVSIVPACVAVAAVSLCARRRLT